MRQPRAFTYSHVSEQLLSGGNEHKSHELPNKDHKDYINDYADRKDILVEIRPRNIDPGYQKIGNNWTEKQQGPLKQLS